MNAELSNKFALLCAFSLALGCGDDGRSSADASADSTDTEDSETPDGDGDADATDAMDATDALDDADAEETTADGSGDASDAADVVDVIDVIDERGCDTTGISKGPWVMGVREDRAVVRWETCREGVTGGLTLLAEGGGEPSEWPSVESSHEVRETIEVLNRIDPVDWAGTWWMHEAQLSDLAPGTCYRYSLSANEERAGRFCTARAAGEDFTFLHIGDTNPGLGDYSSRLLAAVLPPDGETNPDFVLHGGDIQYYDSLLETWAYWFRRFAPMLQQGAFFAAVGNHEKETTYEYEDYYLRYFAGGGFGEDPRWYAFSWGGVWFFSVDTESPFGVETEQGAWLQQALTDAAASDGFRFSVVFLHRPFFSCGDNDHHPEEQAEWEQTFIDNRVLLVLQAHMHAYERFEHNGITYVTSAGGGGGIGDVNENLDRGECGYRVASGEFFHVVEVAVTAAGMTGRAIDETGAVRDEFTISAAE